MIDRKYKKKHFKRIVSRMKRELNETRVCSIAMRDNEKHRVQSIEKRHVFLIDWFEKKKMNIYVINKSISHKIMHLQSVMS